jgi:hypothetical protein
MCPVVEPGGQTADEHAIEIWKCINCGAVLDNVILSHQLEALNAYLHKPDRYTGRACHRRDHPRLG